jgi:3-oxoacyl-(acyl-carrier-protein) synthase
MRNRGHGSKVAVIGMGAESPLGSGISALWCGCLNGVVAKSQIDRFPTADLAHAHAALIAGASKEEAPAAFLAFKSAFQATLAADSIDPGWRGGRVALYFATSHAEERHLRIVDESLTGLEAPGTRTPFHTPLRTAEWEQIIRNTIAERVAGELKLDGSLVSTISAACASANVALAQAFFDLVSGFVDSAVVVSTDALARMGHIGFSQVRALASDRVRPFCTERDGTMIGEGSAAFVLSTMPLGSRAPLAWLLGVGVSADASHHIHPDGTGSGMERATRSAMHCAGIDATSVDVVFLHGSGTRQNDSAEAAALGRIFGSHRPSGAAIKSLVGHSMGAAAGLSAVCAIKTLETGIVPPTPGCEPLEPDCPVTLLESAHSMGTVRLVLNNAYGFGGLNSSVVFGHGSY